MQRDVERRTTGSAFSFAWSFLLLASLSACALPSLQKAQLKPVIAQPVVELTQTPFFPQDIHQCGPPGELHRPSCRASAPHSAPSSSQRACAADRATDESRAPAG
eukprot:TRINITY_DN24817_c0_g1_i7.p1 TRINITY_DN24817_c0_g1~~TRINITY_DN24817_c0_g1_i7.p1  ORF type:complete len:105 (-),score=3.56 TRINITY_DN24817_c0_g1_i7:114-428(-)